MARHKKIRKRLFVDREVQGALLRRLLMQWSFAVVLGFVALLLIQLLSSGERLSVAEHLGVMRDRYEMLFIVLLVALPVLAYDAIKMSHRFAGPVYALRAALAKLSQGEEIPPLTFREGDYWTDVAASVNEIARKLDAQRVVKAENAEDTAADTMVAAR